MNSIKIVVSSDPTLLGQPATTADVERHAEALRAAVLAQCTDAYCDGDKGEELAVDVSIGRDASVRADMGDATFFGVTDSDKLRALRLTLEDQVEQHVRQIAERVWPFA